MNIDITIGEIYKEIKHLKANQAAGPDLYVNELFIHGVDDPLQYLR
jgi:hypothetical protein